MQEPPGGANHGRKRGGEGGWISLSEDIAQAYEEHLTVDPEDPTYHRPVKPEDTIPHGTATAYRNGKCRCDLCRAYKRDSMRRWRNISRTKPEANL